jgi:PKD repeat protein
VLGNVAEIQFNDLSDGAVVSWEWNFGNGEISTEQNPLYYYADEGVYEVTLTITTIDGCVSTYVSHVYVGNPGTPPPLACQAFFFFEQDPVDMMTFNFINFSFGTDLEYEWNFGDGTTSTEMNPTHTYSEDGLYQVDLTVSNDSCSNTMSMIIITDWDIWYDTECNAVFLPVIIPDSNQVFFLNFSSTDAITFEWDFGDGTTSTENSPVHTYDSAGVYTVLLEITTATGCTSSFEVTIDLHNSGFTGDATSSAIQLSTATEEANTFEQITMYPNPMSDQLMIDLGNNIDKEVAYRLFNTAGQLVKSGQLQGSNTIDVSNLLDGFYIIQLNGDGVEYQEKLIKQR